MSEVKLDNGLDRFVPRDDGFSPVKRHRERSVAIHEMSGFR